MRMKNRVSLRLLLIFFFALLIAIPVITSCSNNDDSFEVVKLESSPAVPYRLEENGLLEVEFIDVGQGDSALLSCQDHYMLIDGGKSTESNKIYSILNRKNIDYLDYIIITHTDADHSGGIAGALNKARVGTCYCSEKTDDTKAWQNVTNALYNQGKEITVPEVNAEIQLGEAKITFLAPRTNNHTDNNNSIVCRVDFGDTSFMFTGDAEQEEEEELISSGVNLKADVLKVSHHGSSKCSSSNFINKVMPKYSIISVGKNNYGHPGQETINRLQNINSLIYRTDELGDIIITSNGKELKVECNKGA